MIDQHEMHQFVLTRQTNEFAEWECPVCQRQVRIGNKTGLKILKPGDQSVNHGTASTASWLKLGEALIEETETPTIH